MTDQIESEWTDEFGKHWEVRQQARDGRICAVTLIQPRYGWTPGQLDKARADVRAAVAKANAEVAA